MKMTDMKCHTTEASMSVDAKLLPCPFCGKTPPHVHLSHVTGRIFCEGCGAEGPWSPYFNDGGWNTRTPHPATPTSQEAVPTSGTEREAFDFARRVYKETGVTPELRRLYDFYKNTKNERQTSETEPVAWRYRARDNRPPCWDYMEGSRPTVPETAYEVQLLYTHPPQPSETVAEALTAAKAILAAVGAYSGGMDYSRIVTAVGHIDATLRAMKGGSDVR